VSPLVPLFDFIPTQAYRTPQNPTAPPCPTSCTDFGWEIYPQGLREMLTFAGSLGVPIYITENGLADAADTKRAQYVYDHLATLQQAIVDGVADVRGYFQWSLTDNFEWSSGYYPKFGLFSYDPATGKRRRRKSAKVYRTIAKRNGIPQGLVNRFEP
jgi:beta-galactosidase